MASRLLSASVGGLLLGVSLAFAPACGMSGASGTGSETDGAGGLGSSSATGQGGSVEVNPDADQPPGRLSYAGYCGTGLCEPGATEDGCAGTSDGEEGGGGLGGGTGEPAESAQSCKLLATRGGLEATCAPTGVGMSNSPCQKASDCGPGLGCVGADDGGGGQGGMPGPSAGLCRPYCCGDLEACPSGTFCALAEPIEDPSTPIPVCRPTTPCQLLAEPTCPEDEVCTIVRADGTTSCAPEGDGETCSPCPCAEGYVCATATGVCLKLCRTDARSECGTGSCQGGMLNTPANIGICVGGDAECL